MKINTKSITISAITAAVVFVVTWLIRIPVPETSGGYINLGDVVIYISAYLFGGPITAAAAAIGSALADASAGAVVYVPATFVIKGIMGLVCGCLSIKKSFLSFSGAAIIGGVIMTLGYAVYEWAIFGTAYALASLPFNIIQWIGSIIIAIALYPIAYRTLKGIFLKGA